MSKPMTHADLEAMQVRCAENADALRLLAEVWRLNAVNDCLANHDVPALKERVKWLAAEGVALREAVRSAAKEALSQSQKHADGLVDNIVSEAIDHAEWVGKHV